PPRAPTARIDTGGNRDHYQLAGRNRRAAYTIVVHVVQHLARPRLTVEDDEALQATGMALAELIASEARDRPARAGAEPAAARAALRRSRFASCIPTRIRRTNGACPICCARPTGRNSLQRRMRSRAALANTSGSRPPC